MAPASRPTSAPGLAKPRPGVERRASRPVTTSKLTARSSQTNAGRFGSRGHLAVPDTPRQPCRCLPRDEAGHPCTAALQSRRSSVKCSLAVRKDPRIRSVCAPPVAPRGRWGAPFARFERVASLLAVTAPPAALRCSSPPEGRPNHQVLWPGPVPARHNLDG